MKHDIAHSSTKFITFSKFILQILSLNILHKKTIEYLSWNYSRIVLSFAILSILLGAPTDLNKRRFVGNFIFVNFYSISRKVFPRFSKKLRFYYKKTIYPQFFVECFNKIIHNLGIKMFHQNRGQIFVLCYLICA